jgi:SH3-like domain-containing protein
MRFGAEPLVPAPGASSVASRHTAVGMARVVLLALLIAGLIYGALLFSSKPEVSDTSNAVSQTARQDTPWTRIDPAAQNSPHAIVPDQDLPTAATPTAPAASVGEPLPNAVEHVRVTSAANIRDGPSATTTLLGVAQAGATAQVVSRQEEWVQIIDPASKKTGWIQSSYLETHDQPGVAALSKEEIEAALATSAEADVLASEPSESFAKPRKSKKQGWKRHRKRGFAFRRLFRRVW